MPTPLNKYSSRITQPKSQGASQAMLYATGMTEADMQKPQVGIASVWYEGNTCNMHLDTAGRPRSRKGSHAAGLVGMRFNTIGVSDGISMGTEGMSYSLQSRDLIADSIETVMGAQWYDANISIPGCDKNMPGCLIAMGRLNRPSLMVYGGTIRAGHIATARSSTSSPPFSATANIWPARSTKQSRQTVVRHSLPRRGRLRRHVHGQHDGLGDRSAGHVAALQLVDSGRRPGQARRMLSRRRGDSQSAGARPQAARHHDPRAPSKTRWSW